MILTERKPAMSPRWTSSLVAAAARRWSGVWVALGVFALGAVLGWVWAQYMTPGMLLAHLQGWRGCFAL